MTSDVRSAEALRALTGEILIQPKLFAAKLQLPAVDISWFRTKDIVQEVKGLLTQLLQIDEDRKKQDVAGPKDALRERIGPIDARLLQVSRLPLGRKAKEIVGKTAEILRPLCQLMDLPFQHSATGLATHSPHKFAQLSREQSLAATNPRSTLIQGRSGTGKTLVLVNRISQRWKEEQQRNSSAILFVTRSSLLVEEVSKQLRARGCEVVQGAWPPKRGGVTCITWNGLISLALPCEHEANIDYEAFVERYHCASQVPPAILWAEFNTTLRPFGPGMALGLGELGAWQLSQQEYLQEARSAMGIKLTEEDRRAIYACFKEYCRSKQKRRETDDTDVAVRLAQSAENLHRKICFDALFVDEVQDFSPAQISALLLLCGDPKAITMAGDTCQTVNAGSAFSFKQLVEAFRDHRSGVLQTTELGVKALGAQQRCEEEHEAARQAVAQQQQQGGAPGARRLIAEALARRGVAARRGSARPRRAPVEAWRRLAQAEEELKESQRNWTDLHKRFLVMALRFNFRCKAGIATLARSVSQLLLERFPQAADHINEETTLKGERPLFVRLADRRALDLYIAGRGCRRLHAVDPTCIAILVRSDAARKSLRSRWRKQAIDGLILTPAEAKGLEFDMVILIDFFAESRKAVWDLADDSSDSSQLAAAIAKGTGECAEKRDLWDLALAIPELKTLYVAISRARSGCVFLECDAQKSEPPCGALLERWQEEDLIQLNYPAHAQEDDVPSAIPELQERFGCLQSDELALCEEFQDKGMKLVAHALDDLRERRMVLHEAYIVCKIGMYHAQEWLSKQLGQGWKRELAAAMKEASRAGSWRGCSKLRVLAVLHAEKIWINVAGFLAPGHAGLVASVDHVVDCLREHTRVRAMLQNTMALAHAWVLHTSPRFDVEQQQRYRDLSDQLRQAVEAVNKGLKDFEGALQAFVRARRRRGGLPLVLALLDESLPSVRRRAKEASSIYEEAQKVQTELDQRSTDLEKQSKEASSRLREAKENEIDLQKELQDLKLNLGKAHTSQTDKEAGNVKEQILQKEKELCERIEAVRGLEQKWLEAADRLTEATLARNRKKLGTDASKRRSEHMQSLLKSMELSQKSTREKKDEAQKEEGPADQRRRAKFREAVQRFRRMIKVFNALSAICSNIASAHARAGQAFVAAGRPRAGAEAFEAAGREAKAAVALVEALLKEDGLFAVAWNNTGGRKSAEASWMTSRAQAAQCWLLAAADAHDSSEREEAAVRAWNALFLRSDS